jgi:predicted aspartyl protease
MFNINYPIHVIDDLNLTPEAYRELLQIEEAHKNKPMQSIQIPLQDGLFKVNTTVNGQSVLSIIDTGANVCAMSPTMIQKLNLKVTRHVSVNEPGKSIREVALYMCQLHFGDTIKNIEVIERVMDGYDYQFIVGTNFLRNLNFTYNPTNNTLTIEL